LRPEGGFKPGDIVIHVSDPDGNEAEVVKVDAYAEGEPRLHLCAWGPTSEHFRTFASPSRWPAVAFVLVKRPAPGTRIPRNVPCKAFVGAYGADLDPEFVSGVAAWICDRSPNSSPRPTAFYAERKTRYEQFLRFLEGGTYLEGQNTSLYNVVRYYQYPEGRGLSLLEVTLSRSRGEWELSLFIGLTDLLDRMENDDWQSCAMRGPAPVPHCKACADLLCSKRTGTCEHFTCVRCAEPRVSECLVCTRITQGQLLSAEACAAPDHRVCTACCDHVRCECGQLTCTAPVRRGWRCDACGCANYRDRPTGAQINHCTCHRCPNGQRTRTAECVGGGRSSCDCGNCTRHCTCPNECFPRTTNPLTFFPAKRGDKGLLRMMGTELETAGSARYAPSLKAAVAKWKCNIVRDSSIGGRGMELVTSPAGGSNWFDMINELGVGFKDSEAFTSSACGQHVHVDARDVDVYAMRRIIRLYARVEQSLFDALPRYRFGGHYSAVCGAKYLSWLDNQDKKLTKRWLAVKQYGLAPLKAGDKQSDGYETRTLTAKEAAKQTEAQIKSRAEHKYDSTRYNALNLHSYWHRGTIEFRHAHGTNNPVQIVNWGLVCGSIVDWCVRESDAKLLKLLEDDPRHALLSILPSRENQEWLTSRWEKFSRAPGRWHPEPERDPDTQEL
jgi:hypothetical protein